MELYPPVLYGFHILLFLVLCGVYIFLLLLCVCTLSAGFWDLDSFGMALHSRTRDT